MRRGYGDVWIWIEGRRVTARKRDDTGRVYIAVGVGQDPTPFEVDLTMGRARSGLTGRVYRCERTRYGAANCPDAARRQANARRGGLARWGTPS